MDIFSVLTLCGGLAFFLYGMSVMSSGLEKLAGGRLEQLLKKMTSNPFKSMLLGAGITVAIQSSSAVTVMLVGLVNSGIMELGQTVGIIMGSNIGTTLTAWILSLSGIESGNLWVQLFKPEVFSPALALAGVIMKMASKKSRVRSAGTILVGFAVLMFGMELMKDAVSPLADMPAFTHILTAFSNPLVGVLVGTVVTGIIQSSAASIGILQALALTGGITCRMAAPVIMGQNIGTCVTALLSSIGVARDARRVAVIHVSIKVIGAALFLALFYAADALFGLPFADKPIDAVGIAVIHSAFNVLNTVVLMPFSKQLEKLARRIVRDGEDETAEYVFVDERLLKTPSVAINECQERAVEMARLSKDTIYKALSLIDEYDEGTAAEVERGEQALDKYEDHLSTFLVRIGSKALSEADNRRVSKQLHTVGDFERIGDHALNLRRTAQEISDKDIHFSAAASAELHVLFDALREILDITIRSFTGNDVDLARQVEPLEQVIDCLIADIKSNHIQRLQSGQCTIQLGFVLSDALTDCARVSDHCSNIAVAVIETAQNVYEAHEYLNGVKNGASEEFQSAFDRYRRQYALP